MGLKLGMWISLLLAGRSGSRDLTLGCTIWNVYGKELLSVWCVCWGGLDWGWSHSRLVSGVGCGVEVLLEQVQLNFSFRNKSIILLPCGLLVDNNTFSKMCVFKSLLFVPSQCLLTLAHCQPQCLPRTLFWDTVLQCLGFNVGPHTACRGVVSPPLFVRRVRRVCWLSPCLWYSSCRLCLQYRSISGFSLFLLSVEQKVPVGW